jgi:hypothetical protein
MAPERATQLSWDILTAELRAYRDQQRETWGDLDNALIGRYLAGEATPEERKQVDAALDAHPDLRLLTDLVRDVLGEFQQEKPVLPPPVFALPDNPRNLAQPPAHTAPFRRLQGTVPRGVALGPRPRLLSFPRPRTSSRFLNGLTQRSVLAAAACLLLALGFTLISVPPTSVGSAPPSSPSSSAVALRGGYERDMQRPHQPVVTSIRGGESRPVGLAVAKPSGPLVASLSAAVASGDAGQVARVLLDEPVTRKTLLRPMSSPGPEPESRPLAVPVRGERAGRVLDQAALVLADGLARDNRPRMQARYRQALTVMGSRLGETLQQTTDPCQQRRLVQALRQLGPRARSVVPQLEQLAQSGPPEVRQEAQDALCCICVPQWVGVRDTARVLPEAACKEANNRFEALARKHQVYFVAETVRSLPSKQKESYFRTPKARRSQALAEIARQRSQEIGAERSVFVLISADPPDVHVTLGPDARARLAPKVTDRAMTEVIQKGMLGRDKAPDQGLAEAVRYIEANLAPARK